MTITAEQHYLFSVALRNLIEVGNTFGLSEEQCLNPSAGKWMVDNYKQMLTAMKLSSNQRMLANNIQNIDAHNNASPLPTENPLVTSLTEK